MGKNAGKGKRRRTRVYSLDCAKTKVSRKTEALLHSRIHPMRAGHRPLGIEVECPAGAKLGDPASYHAAFQGGQRVGDLARVAALVFVVLGKEASRHRRGAARPTGDSRDSRAAAAQRQRESTRARAPSSRGGARGRLAVG